MDWAMVWTIIGVNIAVTALMGGFMLWAFSKLDNDIKAQNTKLDNDIKSISTDLKNDMRSQEERLNAQLNAQNARTDQLYQMFIDLLKEQKSSRANF